MIIELDISEEQLDKLLAITKYDETLKAINWQLRGYWLAGEDLPGADINKISNN